jgi:phage-related protein
MIQMGETLAMPESRPMPVVGARCHELRISDGDMQWRIVYRLDRDAVVIGEVFAKKTRRTPQRIIDDCSRRFFQYDRDCGNKP